ncbi:serine hydrolase [Lysobacter sp. F6437]|uniref:serine hydrolase n=1 Tax=Lysobacter sp. F6437 TaxID=3459296 RepID=UPI00403E242D
MIRQPRLPPIALVASLVLALVATGTGKAAIPSTRDPAYASIHADIATGITEGKLTGVAIAVVKDGRIVHEAGFGWADRASGRRATPRTPFSLASATKPITTTAVMTLVRAGKLDLDRPANDYLGDDLIMDAHGPAQAVTLRRLASHSSGLPTFFEMYPEGGPGRQPDVAELIRDYGRLVAPAGERYEYSNLAFAILGEIVARTSRQPFGDYLQEHVFAPLGMHDSFIGTDSGRRAETATRYNKEGEPMPFYVTATPGSGEVFSSAHDMARFAMLHLEDDLGAQASILDDGQLDELHRPHTEIAPGHDYGLGWEVLRQHGGPTVLSHAGGQSGVVTEFALVPEADAAVVVLSNHGGSHQFLDTLRDRLLRTVVPGWQGMPGSPQSPLQPLQPASAYAGTWRGVVQAQGQRIPATLVITPRGTGTFTLRNRSPQPISDLGLIDGLVNGEVSGDIDSPDTRRESLDTLALNLKLRGDRLDGEVIAWRKTSNKMTILPFRTDLHRVVE